MRRLIALIAVLAALGVLPIAAQNPGTLLAPEEVDPALTSTIDGYAAALGLVHVGDCGLFAPGPGGVCSQDYLQDDGTVQVLLLDDANNAAALFTAVPQEGAWVVPPGPPPVPPTASQPVSAPPAEPAIATPISVSATLSSETCSGGTMSVTVVVTDADGNPVEGASVSGHIAFRTSDRGFDLPPTDATGQASAAVQTGSPRGGYTVVWTITARAGDETESTTATCFAP